MARVWITYGDGGRVLTKTQFDKAYRSAIIGNHFSEEPRYYYVYRSLVGDPERDCQILSSIARLGKITE